MAKQAEVWGFSGMPMGKRSQSRAKATIRTITDEQELTLARLDDVRAGNAAVRQTMKELRATLKGGLAEEARLEAELVRLAVAKTKSAAQEGGMSR